MKNLILTILILIVGIACIRQEDIRGTFVNDNSEEITIDCDYHVRSTRLTGKPFMPNNGDSIELSTYSLQAEEIVVSYMWDSILSPFAKWDPYKDEISLGKDIYTRENFAACK